MSEKKEIMENGNKNALQALAERLQVSSDVLQKTLQATAFKECKTNEQFVSAIIVANTYGLNPLLKEMYAFPGKGGGIIPVVGIDGYIKLCTRHKKYNGVVLTENRCERNDLLADPSGSGVESITAKFYLKGIDYPVEVTEYMSECYNSSKEPWKKWSRRMLRHKAYMQGARVAFGFSGIYEEDEAERIRETESQVIDSTASTISGGMVGFKKTNENKIAKAPKEDIEKAKEVDIPYKEKKVKPVDSDTAKRQEQGVEGTNKVHVEADGQRE